MLYNTLFFFFHCLGRSSMSSWKSWIKQVRIKWEHFASFPNTVGIPNDGIFGELFWDKAEAWLCCLCVTAAAWKGLVLSLFCKKESKHKKPTLGDSTVERGKSLRVFLPHHRHIQSWSPSASLHPRCHHSHHTLTLDYGSSSSFVSSFPLLPSSTFSQFLTQQAEQYFKNTNLYV